MKSLKILLSLIIIAIGILLASCNKKQESLSSGTYKGQLLLKQEDLLNALFEISIKIDGDDLYINDEKIGIMTLEKRNVDELFDDFYSYSESTYNTKSYEIYKELIKLEIFWCVGGVSFQYYIFEISDDLYFAKAECSKIMKLYSLNISIKNDIIN